MKALVVMAKGASRAAIVRALEDLSLDVTTASDPYAATVAFALSPADVVVASVAGWRKRDGAFLKMARSRAREAAIVALVPGSDRRLAASMLEAGADAFLAEPVDLDQLTAVVRRALARIQSNDTMDADAAVRSLCADVGHAVNNPLQVASLLLEDTTAPSQTTRASVAKELARIREVVAQVTAFGRLGPPVVSEVPVARVLEAALTAVARDVPLDSRAAASVDGDLTLRVDEGQATRAIEVAVRFLAARTVTRPVPLAISTSAKEPAFVDLILRVAGVDLSDVDAQAAANSVLDVDERTRTTRPGLAFARAIVRGHGGSIAWRRPVDTARGTAIRLRWPR